MMGHTAEQEELLTTLSRHALHASEQLQLCASITSASTPSTDGVLHTIMTSLQPFASVAA